MDETPIAYLSITKANLICNFIYLDVFERTKFAKEQNHEYLIEQFQNLNGLSIAQNIINANVRLFFNHNIKELYWTYRTRCCNIVIMIIIIMLILQIMNIK